MSFEKGTPMSYTESLIRLTRTEVRTLRDQRDSAIIWAALFLLMASTLCLAIGDDFDRVGVVLVVALAIGMLVMLVKANTADVLLTLSRERHRELRLMLKDETGGQSTGPHLHFETGGYISPAEMAAEVQRGIDRANRRARPHG